MVRIFVPEGLMKVAQQFIAGFKHRGRFRLARDDRNDGLSGF
jgi:hypothetical protein